MKTDNHQEIYNAQVVDEGGAMPYPSAPVAPSDIATPLNANHPPQGCPQGGKWARVKYNGQKTWILCIALAACFNIYSGCGACAFLCPQDQKDVYVVNGKVYDQVGECLGNASEFKFL
mmetsp:Transcript_25617/g.32285  ORF Transcript_25617/g.32285 Transcript_25617/m.32285 type:complete len:118 (+) Transcript_25617:44-397(+)